MDVFDAVRRNDLAALKTALPDAASASGPDGASLLMYAAYVGNTEAVTLIRGALPTLSPHEAIILGDLPALDSALDTGWTPATLSPDGFPPLALAVFFRQPAIFERLLPLTPDVDARATNPQQVAAIHAAIAVRNHAALEQLLRAGAAPDLPQQNGITPLQAAARHGDTVACALLVLFGASVALPDDSGQSPIEHAEAGGHDWLARLLTGFARPA